MMGGPAGAQSGWHTAVFAINLVNPQYKKKDRKKKKSLSRGFFVQYYQSSEQLAEMWKML